MRATLLLILCCPGPSNLRFLGWTVIGRNKPALVGNFHNANAATRPPSVTSGRDECAIRQSTPTDTVDVDTCQSTWTMPRVSKQRLAGASDPNSNAHQAECDRHSGPRPARAETNIARYVATSFSARIENVQARAYTMA